MKGLIHFHSSFSYDSNLPIDSILDFADREGLEFLILTDHDTIRGSIELRKRAQERGMDLVVPIAAEYHTEFGDVIGLFLREEITARKLEDFVSEARSQDGILLFPHPYQEHPREKVDQIASLVDLIEVYNQRCSYDLDQASLELAETHSKPTYHGSDAHLKSELGNVFCEVDCSASEAALREELLTNGARQYAGSIKTLRRNICFSQMIKSVKQNRPRLFVDCLISLIKSSLILKLNARCG